MVEEQRKVIEEKTRIVGRLTRARRVAQANAGQSGARPVTIGKLPPASVQTSRGPTRTTPTRPRPWNG